MIIPKKIYDLGLPHRAVAVFCYLCVRADKSGLCYPSVHTIAVDLSLTKRTVYRALTDLENAKVIEREHRKRLRGGKSSNLYTIKI